MKVKAVRFVSTKTKCRYRLPDAFSGDEYSCRFDQFDSRTEFCVFHIPKGGIESSYDIDASRPDRIDEEFRRRLPELIAGAVEKEEPFVDFRGFIFPLFNFTCPPIKIPVDFRYAKFLQDVSFSPEVSDEVAQEYSTRFPFLLQGGADFCNVEFQGEAFFEGYQTGKDLDFSRAQFLGPARLQGVTFNGTTKFDNAVFHDFADFGIATFGSLSFDSVHFKNETDFWSLTVERGASFSEAVFEKEAKFVRAKFGASLLAETAPREEKTGILVDESSFHTSFDEAMFSDKASFQETLFLTEAGFEGTVFKKQTVFSGYKSAMFPEGCDFVGVTLPKDDEFVFDKVYLGKTRFHDTNLEKITFRDVNWGKTKGRLQRFLRGESYILWDEIRPAVMNDWKDESKTAENYRQLVLNYEAKRDYETAEYFHIGEMEMRRRRVGESRGYNDGEAIPVRPYEILLSRLGFSKLFRLWSRFRKYANSYGLYWVSSRYGTSFGQALVLLFILVLVTSYLFLLAGFQSSNERDQLAPIIEYNFFPSSDRPVASLSKMASDFGEALSLTLSIVTFQKDRFYQPISWHSRYVLYFAVIALTAQSAMVLLAIRRRFKR